MLNKINRVEIPLKGVGVNRGGVVQVSSEKKRKATHWLQKTGIKVKKAPERNTVLMGGA